MPDPEKKLDPFTLQWAADHIDQCVRVRVKKVEDKSGARASAEVRYQAMHESITDIHVIAKRLERNADDPFSQALAQLPTGKTES